MATERSGRKPSLLWIGLGCGLLGILLCVSGLVASGAIGTIQLSKSRIEITDVVLASRLDAQNMPIDSAKRFDPTVSRIYCVVTLNASKPISVGARWYYSDTLIMDAHQTIGASGYMSLYRKDGSPFPKGQYRVEVYLVKEPERTVYFEIGP